MSPARAGPFTVRFPKRLPVERRGEHWWLEADGHNVRLSNLDKVFWPEEGITKGDVVAYYFNVASTILPHVQGRPLTLKRMPEGVAGPSFFQKNAPPYTPDWITLCAVEPEDTDIDEMVAIETTADLLWVANVGAIELHPLHGRCERYDSPDYMVFDLDPMPPAGFTEALRIAQHVHVALDKLGLNGYPKTSGATGLQIYVPVEEKHTYDETRALAGAIARLIRRADPDGISLEWSVKERAGRVFIDYNMNRRAASLASAYSVRPQSGATVSTPLTWDEVAAGRVRPELFTIRTIFKRLDRVGDLFAAVARERQDLDPVLDAMGIARSRRDISEGRLRRAAKASQRLRKRESR